MLRAMAHRRSLHLRGAWVIALALASTPACDTAAEPEATPAAEAAAPAAATVEISNDPSRTTFAGDWWVLCTDLPHQGFKLSLLAPQESEGFWEGSWISFDWRGTAHPGALARASAAVAVSAHRGSDGTIVITGPVPQIDALGLPTGDTGAWELAVQQISLTGQPLRYSGSMRHSETADLAVPLTVELETSFRVWTR